MPRLVLVRDFKLLPPSILPTNFPLPFFLLLERIDVQEHLPGAQHHFRELGGLYREEVEVGMAISIRFEIHWGRQGILFHVY